MRAEHIVSRFLPKKNNNNKFNIYLFIYSFILCAYVRAHTCAHGHERTGSKSWSFLLPCRRDQTQVCKHDSNHLYPLNPLKNAIFALRQVFFPAGYADPEISSQVSPPTSDSDYVELQACTTLLCFGMRLGGKSHDQSLLQIHR